MKKYKFTLLLGVLIILGFTQITKPNSSLDNKELFKKIEKNSNTVENYINIKDIKVSKSKREDKKIKEKNKFKIKDFANEYYQSKLPNFLKKENSNTAIKNEEEVSKPYITEYYNEKIRNHIMYENGIPNDFLISEYVNNGSSVTENYYLKEKGKTTASLDNLYTAESTNNKIKPLTEYTGDNPYKSLDYKEILPILENSTKFIDVTEVDEYYVFKEEFNKINDKNLIKLMTDLKINEDIDKSNVITFDELINTEWEKEDILVNFTVPSRDLAVNKFMFAATVAKDDKQYGIRFELNLEQFNIVDNFNLDKINERIEG